MNKKLQLFCIAVLSSILLKGQMLETIETGPKTSGTEPPSQQWNEWFNKEVEKFEKSLQTGRTSNINYRIPVVFHIVNAGEAVGTYPNLDSTQINSQIRVLNQDYGGVGVGVSGVPQIFASLVANTGITFCLAKRDPTNALLTEPGIHRINGAPLGWASPSSTANIVSYVNNVVKPNNCWDPTKYLNIWVCDRSSTLTILGFATYPAGTALIGIPNSGGTALNDGVWVWAKALGNIGTLSPSNNKGRTATHEIAHWLGVRNIWGDGNCLDDYCDDTPWAKQANTGCPTFPSFVNRCGIGQSPDGEMTMNFMDATDDACRYMFTPRQVTRMQTAMSQCNFRNLLGTHNLCTYTQVAAPAVAGFTFHELPCAGVAITPDNTSTGWPWPTYQWSTAPSANISPAPSVASPIFTFPTVGTYTIYMTATNTANIASYTTVINVVACPPSPLCLDTIKMIKNNDTLTTYHAQNSSLVPGCQSGFAGYLTGTNCYRDKEFAQFIPANTYSAINLPQVNSVIVLFDSNGTRATSPAGTTPITCVLSSGSATTGPNSQLTTKTDYLSTIVAATKTTAIKYVGDPTVVFPVTRIIPFKFDFPQPYPLTPLTPGFFVSVQTPYNFINDSINIFSNTKTNHSVDSSSWVLLNPSNNWRTMRYARGARLQLAMLPQITCRPVVGIKENTTEFNSNITVMPNPNNGRFDLIFTLTKEQNIYLNLYNAIGEQISTQRIENVMHNMMEMDLSGKSDGIYFLDISNGQERVVRKIVISH